MTHLGARISALVDGELGHEARDRALAHVAHCADLPRAARRRARRQGALARSRRADRRRPTGARLAAGRWRCRAARLPPRARTMPQGPVVPVLPPPGRAPRGARADSRGPPSHGARTAAAPPAGPLRRRRCALGRRPGARHRVRRGGARQPPSPVVPAGRRAVRRAHRDHERLHARRPRARPVGRPSATCPSRPSRDGETARPRRRGGASCSAARRRRAARLAGRTAPPQPGRPVGRPGRRRPVVEPEARRLLDRAAAAPATTSYHGVQFVSAWTRAAPPARSSTSTTSPAAAPRSAPTAPRRAPARSMTLALAAPRRSPRRRRGAAVAHYSLSVVGAGPGRRPGRRRGRRPPPGAPPPLTDAPASGWTARAAWCCAARSTTSAAAPPGPAPSSRSPSAAATCCTDAGQRPWPPTHRPPPRSSAMRDAGLALPGELPGPLTLVDARRGGEDGGIVHLSYSDGIATVSVFEQRGRLDPTGLAGYQRRPPSPAARSACAATCRGGWSGPRRHGLHGRGRRAGAYGGRGGRGAAAPPAADGGTLGRLGRGLDRVASWFNPFG